MLLPARRKQRGTFTSKKLSGAARRAAELFEPKDSSSSQAYEPFLAADHRPEHQVKMQEQAVRVTVHIVHISHTVECRLNSLHISLC